MTSYFTLELDTTSPIIEIFSPSYTVRGIDNDIEVVADEQLSSYQDIYIIDSNGIRYNYIFSYSGDRFIGMINFSDVFPTGSATLYATVKDTVHNISQQIYVIIEILSDSDALRLKTIISDIQREVVISDKVSDITVLDFDPTILIISDSDPSV